MEHDKIVNKFETQAFNYAVKVLVQTSDPNITKGEAYKIVSSRWGEKSYRKEQTQEYLSDRINKVSTQLDQLTQCLNTLVEYLN